MARRARRAAAPALLSLLLLAALLLTAATDQETPRKSKAKSKGRSGPGSDEQERIKKLMDVSVEALGVGNLTALDADPSMWLVAVHGGGEGEEDEKPCAPELAKFEAAAKAAQGVVKYGALALASDTATAASEAEKGLLEAMGIDLKALEAEPCQLQVVLLPHGANKAKLDEYKRWSAPLDDPKALQAWLLEDAPDTTEALVSEQALHAFMAVPPDPAGPRVGRVVLVTSKEEVPAVFKALALNLAAAGARYQFGWIGGDAPEAFRVGAMKALKVDTVPALVAAVPYSGPEAKRPPDAPEGAIPVVLQPFRGPIKYQAMWLWLRGLAAVTGVSDEELPGTRKGSSSSTAVVTPVTTQEELDTNCYKRGALCVIALLNGAPDDAQADALKKALAWQEAKQPGLISVVTVDASRQPELRETLGGISREALPTIAIVSAKRRRYARAPAAFALSATGVGEVLAGVLSGKIPTVALQDLPRLVDGGVDEDSPDDAAASEADAVDEFDLSEIMSEDVGLASKEDQLKKAEEEMRAEAEAAAAKKAAEEAAKKSAAKKKKGKKKKGGKKKQAAKDEL